MIKLYHIFKNTAETEYNDLVYNRSNVLDLEPFEYSITLSPFSSTKYWRFGLALSQQENFEFNPSKGRYSNRDLRFIEVDVGERPAGQWIYPNRIALGCYYYPMESPLKRYESYIEEAEVTLGSKVNAAANTIDVTMNAPGCPNLVVQLPFDNYRFVKFFAWADHSFYELGCSIQAKGRLEKDDFERYPQPSEGTNWWLLKLSENPSDRIDFGPHNFGYIVHAAGNSKKVDEDYFDHLKKGNKILGYQSQLQVVTCSLQVEEFMPKDPNGQQAIKFRILQYFNPYIQVGELLEHFIFRRLMSVNSPYRLICLSSGDFEIIVAKDYEFPLAEITTDERKYLAIMYDNWLNGKEITTSYSLQEIWNEFPTDFAPDKINPLLLLGRVITLWGISQIHPESDIFDKFDWVIRTIKGLLSRGEGLNQITTKQIANEQKELNEDEIFRIFRLMIQFPDMIRSFGHPPAGGRSIELSEDRFYATYKKYMGLKEFMYEFLTRRGIKYDRPLILTAEASQADAEPALYRTEMQYRDRSKFTPVMGVETLAFDVANVIKQLPQEKGQMVGIFGKWGRGKTFFLQQIWSELKKSKGPRFIRITYDAWKYQETPASWAYLYEKLLEGYLGKPKGRNLIHYPWKLLVLNLKRNGLWSIVKFLAAVGATIASWFLPWKKYNYAIVPISVLALSQIITALRKEYSAKAINLIKKYSIRNSYKSQMGLQADIQAELIKLLEVWIPKKETQHIKIILEVEDIDRCRQEKVIENIDGLRTMLEDDAIAERLIILTAIDERILKSAIYAKYQSVAKNNDSQAEEAKVSIQELIIEQLDKLFITAIKLGDILESQRLEFVNALLRGQVEENAESSQPIEEKKTSIGMKKDTPPFQDTLMPLDEQDIPSGMNDRRISEIEEIKNMEPTPQATGYPVDSWQKLMRSESQPLKDLVRTWERVTPRKVWIFYYRYLLCKNLLIGKYIKEKRVNSWQTEQGAKDLMVLLKYFSELHEPKKIEKEQKRIVSLGKPEVAIDFVPGSPEIRTTDTDYLHLLHILEMVIAY